ncbi:MAG: NAD(P)-dependent alcohol dehydrogenase [Sphingomonas sp.]
MHVIELRAAATESLTRTEWPEPAKPGHGEALIWMHAAAFNFIDVAVAAGPYPGALYPNAPVADGAGEVVAVGDGVDTVSVGDRVAIHPKSHWIAGRGTAQNGKAMRGVTISGSLVELALVDAVTLVKAPDHLSWEQIASLPISATTGWNALQAGNIGPGSTIVLPGTGVTALQTLQLAKAAGAKVIVTSSSDDKLASATALGADHGINYRANPNWETEVLSLTGGVGADLILETTGAATVEKSLAAVRQGGTVFMIGFVSGTALPLDMMPIIVKAIRMIGNNTGSVADFQAAMDVVAAHRISPVVAETFGVADTKAAYLSLDREARFGKVALNLNW